MAQDMGLQSLHVVYLLLVLVVRRSAHWSASPQLADGPNGSSPAPFQGCCSSKGPVFNCNGLRAHQGLQKAGPPLNLLATLRGFPQPARPVPPPPCLDGLLLGLYLRNRRHVSVSGSGGHARVQPCSSTNEAVQDCSKNQPGRCTAQNVAHPICPLNMLAVLEMKRFWVMVGVAPLQYDQKMAPPCSGVSAPL